MTTYEKCLKCRAAGHHHGDLGDPNQVPGIALVCLNPTVPLLPTHTPHYALSPERRQEGMIPRPQGAEREQP